MATIGGREQLVISGGGKLTSYDPATGEELWSVDAIAEAVGVTGLGGGQRRPPGDARRMMTAPGLGGGRPAMRQEAA